MTNETTYERTISQAEVPTYYAHIDMTEPLTDDPNDDRTFEYRDTLRATWVEDKYDHQKEDGHGWWTVFGDNAGTGNSMIIHPYMIDSMIELLQAVKNDPRNNGLL